MRTLSQGNFLGGCGAVAAVLVLSFIGCHDRLTWVLETAPVMLALPFLVATRSRWPLTSLLYGLIAVHALILIVGGHYTYALVPLGDWMQAWFGFERNHYDRIGHFAQGFVPAMIAREVLRRSVPMQPGGMLGFVCVACAMFVSSVYEIIEMIAGRVSAEGAAAFLGTQGDVWDTQMDMTLALMGATAAMLLLSRAHDRALAA